MKRGSKKINREIKKNRVGGVAAGGELGQSIDRNLSKCQNKVLLVNPLNPHVYD